MSSAEGGRGDPRVVTCIRRRRGGNRSGQTRRWHKCSMFSHGEPCSPRIVSMRPCVAAVSPPIGSMQRDIGSIPDGRGSMRRRIGSIRGHIEPVQGRGGAIAGRIGTGISVICSRPRRIEPMQRDNGSMRGCIDPPQRRIEPEQGDIATMARRRRGSSRCHRADATDPLLSPTRHRRDARPTRPFPSLQRHADTANRRESLATTNTTHRSLVSLAPPTPVPALITYADPRRRLASNPTSPAFELRPLGDDDDARRRSRRSAAGRPRGRSR